MTATTMEVPSVATPTEPVRAFYCRRCDNPRPLGMVAPGRFYWRLHGRTVIAEGGTVRVWCERCTKEHRIDLGPTAPAE